MNDAEMRKIDKPKLVKNTAIYQFVLPWEPIFALDLGFGYFLVS